MLFLKHITHPSPCLLQYIGQFMMGAFVGFALTTVLESLDRIEQRLDVLLIQSRPFYLPATPPRSPPPPQQEEEISVY